jgi:hypothetical protein
MQKLILVERNVGFDPARAVLTTEILETFLSDGWRVVSVSPVGTAVAQGGITWNGFGATAFTVLIEKP